MQNRLALQPAFSLEGIRSQYIDGIPHPDRIKPESYTLNTALIARPGIDIQLDLFLDYASNVNLYPDFQRYFRQFKSPLLAIWGKFDAFFLPTGAEAFSRDDPNATYQLLEAGHFALETDAEEIGCKILEFLADV